MAHDPDLMTVTAAGARYPLLCRPGTSDLCVFRQVFFERAFAFLDATPAASFIIDCGANVGYAAADFLTRYPDCTVVAIEPDPDNFALLARNLAPYGPRARALHAAVWSHPAALTLCDGPYRDGREWARQVRECRPGEPPAFQAVDLGGVLRDAGWPRVDVLKVDIEGAEGVVFARNFESWLDRVALLAIEIHDDSYFGDCSVVVRQAIAGRGFHVARHGELTVCRRRGPLSA